MTGRQSAELRRAVTSIDRVTTGHTLLETVPLNDLARGASEQRLELGSAIERVVTRGWYVHGGEHAAFESELAAFLGVDACVGVANGTDALEFAIRALASWWLGRVMAANAGSYASTAARRAGCAARYADIDRTTLTLDWSRGRGAA